MINSIKDVFYGNFDGMDLPVGPADGYRRAARKTGKQYEKLLETLNQEQRQLLESFSDAMTEETCQLNEVYFTRGFSLGLRLAAEAFCRE